MSEVNPEFSFKHNAKSCDVSQLVKLSVGSGWNLYEYQNQPKDIIGLVWEHREQLAKGEKLPYIYVQRWICDASFSEKQVERSFLRNLNAVNAECDTLAEAEKERFRSLCYNLCIDEEAWYGGIMWNFKGYGELTQLTTVAYGYTSDIRAKMTKVEAAEVLKGLS